MLSNGLQSSPLTTSRLRTPPGVRFYLGLHLALSRLDGVDISHIWEPTMDRGQGGSCSPAYAVWGNLKSASSSLTQQMVFSSCFSLFCSSLTWVTGVSQILVRYSTQIFRVDSVTNFWLNSGTKMVHFSRHTISFAKSVHYANHYPKVGRPTVV